ncbi:MAG: hypothetical protein EOO09_11415 [Chitinophagaceae bacterium]|nr:MAG: hypothetical protein EOO09_11415 [Chitinophagaceae bacterium]
MSTRMEAQVKNSPWLQQLVKKEAGPVLRELLAKPDSFQYQLIYTRITRDKKNRPSFEHFYLNVDRDRYFNPASMVKLPTALVAMEKLAGLAQKGIDRNTPMLTDSAAEGQVQVWTDSSLPGGRPTIGNYVKQVFVVSDNDSYNRLYEFTGQELLNRRLQEMGYADARITRRFMRLTEDQNRVTNPVRFAGPDDRMLYSQPMAESRFTFDFSRQWLVGQAHYDRDDKLVQEPMDFTRHNFIPLEDLQQMMQSLLFPRSVPATKRWQVPDAGLPWLWQVMSELPFESRYPRYDTSEFFPSYTKFFFFRDGKRAVPAGLRSFSKAGWSYGFLTEVAYIIDTVQGVEFMLSGTIYVNPDGVLNDDKYEYENRGYPFFRETGEIIYRYELGRKRKYRPDLSEFILTYD